MHYLLKQTAHFFMPILSKLLASYILFIGCLRLTFKKNSCDVYDLVIVFLLNCIELFAFSFFLRWRNGMIGTISRNKRVQFSKMLYNHDIDIKYW